MAKLNFNKLFADNLNRYLTKSDMTQAELAKLVNVSTASVSNWCKGIKMPRIDKIDKICDIFGCEHSDLMEEKRTALSPETTFTDNSITEIVNFLLDNPECKEFFSALCNLGKEDILLLKQILDRLIQK